jgi:hypothetical protein
MISNRGGIKELQIFDNFEIDRKLSKYTQNEELNKVGNNSAFITINSDNEGSIPVEPGVWFNTPSGVSVNHLSFRDKLANWISRKPKVKTPVAKIGVIEFFTNLSKSFEELTPIAEIATHYEKALLQANTMGQIALVEKLKDLIDVVRGEAHLIQMGLKKYVTEKQVINFYELVGEDKNLKLTWIKNFGRIIPEDVYKAKKSVDERNIFDNYVILHYDPANNGEKLTKKEIEKKKDPILFGVIKNSRKLYYIADWKDDYCELTLDEMFNQLGGKVLTINNKTVKTFIDKTIV